MGLHRELDDTSLGSYSREYRRRVLWHIVWLDVQTSLATGLPTCCGDALKGVELPNSFRYGATPAKYRIKPSSWQREPDQSLILLLAIAQYGAAGLQNGFIRHFGGNSLSQQKVDDLKDAMVQTARLIDRLDAMIRRFNPADYEPEYALPIDSPMDDFVYFQRKEDLVSSLFSNWVRQCYRCSRLSLRFYFKRASSNFPNRRIRLRQTRRKGMYKQLPTLKSPQLTSW